MIYTSKSPKDTKKLASKLAKKTKRLFHGKAAIIALEGELGAGKTTFVQGFAKAFGVKSKIKSPTFVLMKIYKKRPYAIYHIDCYRLKDYRDLLPLGIKDIFNNKDNIVLVEWADRISRILPPKHTTIHIDHIDSKTRKISIK